MIFQANVCDVCRGRGCECTMRQLCWILFYRLVVFWYSRQSFENHRCLYFMHYQLISYNTVPTCSRIGHAVRVDVGKVRGESDISRAHTTDASCDETRRDEFHNSTPHKSQHNIESECSLCRCLYSFRYKDRMVTWWNLRAHSRKKGATSSWFAGFTIVSMVFYNIYIYSQ